MFDLRSDTVTKPSPAMREAIAEAEVGDDVYGEDPEVDRLERDVAARVGKERALFVPSGTMANQVALLCHTERGDEVVIGEGAHLARYESGAAAAWSGVQFSVAGSGGLYDAEQLRSAITPAAYYLPRTRLIAVENTHNMAGGLVFPQDEIERIARVAREASLGLHLDGARLWNASVATGRAPAELAAPFDTVSVCFSKGLGAPVGSALCGSGPLIERARRFRKMLGGGMRQAGVLAAAARFGLEHNLERLERDHVAARELAALLARVPGVSIPAPVQTNIVLIELEQLDATTAMSRAREADVLIGAVGPRTLRAVTHLDVSHHCADAGERLARAFSSEAA